MPRFCSFCGSADRRARSGRVRELRSVSTGSRRAGRSAALVVHDGRLLLTQRGSTSRGSASGARRPASATARSIRCRPRSGRRSRRSVSAVHVIGVSRALGRRYLPGAEDGVEPLRTAPSLLPRGTVGAASCGTSRVRSATRWFRPTSCPRTRAAGETGRESTPRGARRSADGGGSRRRYPTPASYSSSSRNG